MSKFSPVLKSLGDNNEKKKDSSKTRDLNPYNFLLYFEAVELIYLVNILLSSVNTW